ncbi:hydroxyethylthiazole kinase [Rouxiella badensis]|jgi:hydroxyethylthiazole kinase|uniref:Hydroxyethylthiazole kinase n=1 Tax=Rouxiella badensis TaxID=1646377 RepID=A0A1X0WID1_9GAMM|nr:hydroxyethylthiazole kinase [Rouxiella badensis]MCC3704091.1 hydroxyethylthiazole kinase [Rouxiella badensis]MCC3748665.1 hydroxyethylthiazole kinase [Rouxiella badensis]ORJ26511.1 hydroxyethylthiazole kinase [Rouxiella badensis]QII38075.1 hydroxyethylthiazole kinase [Rouxiella badensis]QOI56053.1 hydroxyethylthiazole kinase [Rouxiella badensis subsp. acadiensis]
MTTRPTVFPGAYAASALQHLRQASPLVHCITNDVVQSITANVLLALGASPAMVVDPREAAQFSAMASALLVNVGTLTESRAESMLAAIHAANQAQKPWVLDPVAVGALSWRSEFCQEIIRLQPAAIRGNASEIMALSGLAASGRGVDSADTSLAALPAAQTLARQTGAIIAVTGEIDYVTDGENSVSVPGGNVLMTRVVGTGCALSAVVAAFTSLPGDRLANVAAACRVMSRAGELACEVAKGPGSFTPAFMDNLYLLDAEKLNGGAL